MEKKENKKNVDTNNQQMNNIIVDLLIKQNAIAANLNYLINFNNINNLDKGIIIIDEKEYRIIQNNLINIVETLNQCVNKLLKGANKNNGKQK